MYVEDVIRSLTQHASQLTAKGDTERDASLRIVGVDRLAAADPNHTIRRSGARQIRRDDVDVMPAPTCLPGEEVHVLAHAAQVRIVVLRHQRDAQGTLVVRIRQSRKIRERWPALERGAT